MGRDGCHLRDKASLGATLSSAAINATATEYVVDITDYVSDALSGSGGAVNVAFTEPTSSPALLALIYGKDSNRPPVLEITTAYEP